LTTSTRFFPASARTETAARAAGAARRLAATARGDAPGENNAREEGRRCRADEAERRPDASAVAVEAAAAAKAIGGREEKIRDEGG